MTVVRSKLNFQATSEACLARQLNASVCRNWYGTVSEDGKFQTPLFPFPGSELWSDDGSTSSVRKLYSLNDIFYAVVGNQFRIYSDDGLFRNIGRLETSTGDVDIIANDTQIFINDFKNGYVYQLLTTSSRKAGEFFQIEKATTFVSLPVFVGKGSNDLSITGSYTGNGNRNYKIQIDGSSTSYFSAVTFADGALNDISFLGVYAALQVRTYKVQIDATGAVDKFRWSDNGGATWNVTGVDITGTSQNLNNGVSIRFNSVTGHTLWSSWTVTVYPAGYQDTFRWSDDGGTTWKASGLNITSGAQALEYGLSASFQHSTGHVTNDFWDFSVTVDSAFYAPLVPAYLNTRGIFIKQRSKRFYLTDLEDFSKINALNFAQANSWPDNLVAAIVVNQELILLCETSIEFWYDAGSSGFPFLKRPNLLVPYGIIAPHSLVMGGQNLLFWFGRNKNGGKVVLMMSGYQVEVISNEGMHQAFQEYTNVDKAKGFILNWQGHTFYFLTFPDDDVTWVFDTGTKLWVQRTTRRKSESISSNEYIEGRYLANCHVYHRGENYVGHWNCGKIFKLSSQCFKDGDERITCEIVTTPLQNNLNRVSFHSLQLDFEASTTAPYGEASDPVVCLQHSDDGSYEWSKETRKGMGKIGETQRRCKWNALGTSRSRVFKIKTDDPVFRVLMGIVAELEDLGR